MKKPDIVCAIKLLIDVFKKTSISYFIGGSIASSAYGKARATLDVDIIADIPAQKVKGLVEQLKGEYYAEEESIIEAVHASAPFNIIHLETMFKVDIYPLKNRAYDIEAFQRRKEDTFAENTSDAYFLSSPEDVILSKLEWFEAGNRISERQWQDILGILIVQRDHLDVLYLKKWALKLGLLPFLEQAMKEAEK
jgi:hypothetical protein